MTLFDIFMPEEKKIFHETKDLTGPCRFQTVDSVGHLTSWTKLSVSRAHFCQDFSVLCLCSS